MASLPSDERREFTRWIAERAYDSWLATMFPDVMYDLAQHHEELWQWFWQMPQDSPDPFVAIWPRAGAKSTNAELGVISCGARHLRKYCLYVSETQDQADDHVATIAGLLDRATVNEIYPALARPLLNKLGDRKGWRRNRLRTATGFTVDALGLDTAARGAKVDEFRPDLIVFDDIDNETDAPATIEKKISQITRKIIPAGAWNSAVIFVQNLVHEHSIVSRLAGVSTEKADFLHDRRVSGPFPALRNAAYEQDNDGKWTIITGEPIWSGMDLARCNALMKKIGYTAFRVECQQEVAALPGGMFDHISFRHCTWEELPPLVRTVVWIDPATTSNDRSDCNAIQVDSLGADGTVYRLYSWEHRATPVETLMRGLELCVRYRCTVLGIETDQGGDTWQSVFNEAIRALLEDHNIDASGVVLREEKAGAGYGSKVFRAQQQLAAYEQATICHVLGTHEVLEKAFRRFPRAKPYDLVDVCYWTWLDLAGTEPFNAATAGQPAPLTTFAMR